MHEVCPKCGCSGWDLVLAGVDNDYAVDYWQCIDCGYLDPCDDLE